MAEIFKICTPAPIPVQFQGPMALIDKEAAFQYDNFGIPYAIQAKMAEQRYTCLEDIAERWAGDTVRLTASEDLAFEDMKYDKADQTFYVTRLIHVIKKAREIKLNEAAACGFGVSTPSQAQGSMQLPIGSQAMVLVDKQQRSKLLSAWKSRAPNHPPPKLSEMGSPDMVKRMTPQMEGGEIPNIDIKHIVPAQPETMDKPLTKTTWSKNQYGAYVEIPKM